MYRIETESGAAYDVDPDTMHIRRIGPVADTDANKPDGEWLSVEDIEVVVGYPALFYFRDGRVRVTTPVKRLLTP